ncbi:MAG TPA: tRNA (N6-isopentenyl adenosine(37)-C2)-methylthiotransferase MiaB [Chitinophagales bacterium]|nr:tRNA (N6-isopentenyl adenosine(37)-C2)-methylthiotransferase MiaB [Chitinophagales bacterium]
MTAGLLTEEILEKQHDESRQGQLFSGVKITEDAVNPHRKFYIETYGCAMNFSDSEIVASVLMSDGFSATTNFLDADLVLINTCSIRENAEQKVRNRLAELRRIKKSNPDALIGVLGCMAERLKSKFLEEEKLVDLVVGPDSYRDLPKLVTVAEDGQKAVNVLLSREETYADINPVRLNSNGVTAFISITRGCNNMCSFCVVPFTRGRERSRDPYSIVTEAKQLFNESYREVTLLGQNVDSYFWKSESSGESTTFAQLLEQVAWINPKLRVRFSTSHPKDITDEVLFMITKHQNICKSIHLPVQSGSSEVLKRMNRTYDREWYRSKIDRIREVIPGCGITTDIISGFCGETDDDHQQTLSMMEYVKYDMAYMFKYSERPGTPAAKKFSDDISEEIKSKRLSEIVELQHLHQHEMNISEVGREYEVLVESTSKRSKDFFSGRNSQNKVVVFPKKNFQKGDYATVRIVDFTSATLIGDVI